jgi:hypothetical protein
MFETRQERVSDRVQIYVLMRNGQELSFADVIELWQSDEAFRTHFLMLLCESPFDAYRWETPAVTRDTTDRRFEFVLLNSPRLARPADRKTYSEYFGNANDDDVVVFDNLSKDSTLVSPVPPGPNAPFSDLASFVRSASDSQRHSLWRKVGQTMQRKINERPVWLNTAGGGVAWLHVRLDSRPKYYGYAPYKSRK